MKFTVLEMLRDHSLSTTIGWALVHFVWQGLLAGAVCAVALAVVRNCSPSVRYAVCCLGLLCLAVLPLATGAYLVATDEAALNRPRSQVVTARPAEVAQAAETPAGFVDTPVVDVAVAATATAHPDTGGSAPDSPAATGAMFWRLSDSVRAWLPWVVVVWGSGVCLLALRLLAGFYRIRQWRLEAAPSCSQALNTTFERLLRRMRLRRNVRLLESSRSAGPAVMGWLRPVILLPASLVTGLTTSELEPILAHELAHIRRHDYLVNLLQVALETVLFYHPAVWWLSRRTRIEREYCCDDLAIEACGNRLAFARALSRLEEMRCRQHRLSVAAADGSLVARIRRIVTQDATPRPARWPAGLAAVGVLTILVSAVWFSPASAGLFDAYVPKTAVSPGATGASGLARDDEEEPHDKPKVQEQKFAVQKSEVSKDDSRTGATKRVFAGIRLRARHQASVDMMYSNVMSYSFIPARIARALGARELGQIDFGEQAPPRPAVAQSGRVSPSLLAGSGWTGLSAAPAVREPVKNAITVGELSEPAGDRTVVPYAGDAVWVPGHLGVYGVNKTKQHVFRIVRIESVDLGVGPEFGPINALVLEDENSEFGVLGRDWVSQPRGERGESLWFTFDGTLHFVAPPRVGVAAAAEVQKPQPGSVTVSSTGPDPQVARLARAGVRVLASHTYSLRRRQSTGWVTDHGMRVPIDDGVEHAGVIVYSTLFSDIVAIDAQSSNVLWSVPWKKGSPTWQTVSIVELAGDAPRLAVEIFATAPRTRELVYQYYSLRDGERIELSDETGAASENGSPAVRLPAVQVVEPAGDRVTRAVIKSVANSKTPAPAVSRTRVSRDVDAATGAVVESATLVEAAVPPRFADSLEADTLTFMVPRGTGLRAEFSGRDVAIHPGESSVRVIVTDGAVELVDATGVVRARATADGGAEQLVAECRFARGVVRTRSGQAGVQVDLDDVSIRLRSQRLQRDPGYPNPPVEVKMSLATGAPAAEVRPADGAVRYAVESTAASPTRMVWRRYSYRNTPRSPD